MNTAVPAHLADGHLTWEDVNDNNLSSIRPGFAYVRLNWGPLGAESGPPGYRPGRLMVACRG